MYSYSQHFRVPPGYTSPFREGAGGGFGPMENEGSSGGSGLVGNDLKGDPRDKAAWDSADNDTGGGAGGGGGDDDSSGGGGGGGGGGRRHFRWVTVATFGSPALAHLARLKLESEEIPCVIVDENIVAMDWLLSPAVGGIKLQVPSVLRAVARAVLFATGEWSGDQPIVEGDPCPHCPGGVLRPGPPLWWQVVLSIVLLGMPLMFLPKRHVCDSCGKSPGRGRG